MQLHGSYNLRGFGKPDFICRRFAMDTVLRQNRLQILCRGILAGEDDVTRLSLPLPRIIHIPIVQMKGRGKIVIHDYVYTIPELNLAALWC